MAQRPKLILLVLVGLAIAGLGFLLAARPSPDPGVAPEPAPAPPRMAARVAAIDTAPAPPPAAAPMPAPSPAPAPRPAAKRAGVVAPQCVRDSDCKGPRQADCTRAVCKAGKCIYDQSRCECRTNDDCDDGDPCTRNHCFVATMKCVFIKDGCPKE